MYIIFYFLLSLIVIFFIYNKKELAINQNLYLLFLSNFLLIFFLFNNISADKGYYNDTIFSNNYFSGFSAQGYDLFFFYFGHIISFFQYPKFADLILYPFFIYSTLFFSKKFQNPLFITLLFFPYIYLVVMQGFTRQAWALGFIIMAVNLLFKLKNNYKVDHINQLKNEISILFLFIISTFFHFSAIIFLLIYIAYLFYNQKKTNKITFIIIFSFILCILLLNTDILQIYLIKINHYRDFLATRENYSLKGFLIRFSIIFISSIIILISRFIFINPKKQKILPLDNFFLICSLCYLIISLLLFIIDPKLSLILDRLGIYFYLINIYFLGRFIYFISAKKIQPLIQSIAIIFFNIYLLLWINFSQSYYEFKYNFLFFGF